jgi:hypothetical protein
VIKKISRFFSGLFRQQHVCAGAEQEKALQADVAYLDLEALALRQELQRETPDVQTNAAALQAVHRQRRDCGGLLPSTRTCSATGGRMGRAAGVPLF